MKTKENLVKQSKIELIDSQRLDVIYGRVSSHINNARSKIQKSVDVEMIKAYWLIGREIVEEEQQGSSRAEYGKALIFELAQKLKEQYGKGFSKTNVKYMCQFYLEYQANRKDVQIRQTLSSEFEDFKYDLDYQVDRRCFQIGQTVSGQFESFQHSLDFQADRGNFQIGHSVSDQFEIDKEASSIRYAVHSEFEIPKFLPNLGWSHYIVLMRIARLEARAFYEIEASKNNWSVRELERQIGSLLFDRLAKSKDKKGLMELAYSGQEIVKPEDAIKDPLVFEFLGLPESPKLVESTLEEAVINNLQQFLLELGKGFAFVARQKRLTLDGDHFYTDLVFYHVVLKCYVVIDLKTRKLNHADLGQMLLYVNYFDQEVKVKEDNPTIGLVLCTEKSDTMVKYTLGEKGTQIFTSKYQFHLPTEEELEKEIKREVKAIEEQFK